MGKIHKELKELEKEFLRLRVLHKDVGKMQELMKISEIAKVLQEIGTRKKHIQKLEFAIKDTNAISAEE